MKELLEELRGRDIKLWPEGDSLRYSAPAGALTPELRAKMSAHKAELLAHLSDTPSAGTVIPRVDRSGGVPLSFAQEQLWLLDRLEPGLAAYNVARCWRIAGPLDQAALERSLHELERRHEILRTTFSTAEDGTPVQRVHPFAARALPLVSIAPGDLEEISKAEAAHPFDLAAGPLWRVTLARLGKSDHALFLTWHHIICDAWSDAIFARELTALYAAFHARQPCSLPDLPLQFGDYAHWQRATYGGEALAAQLAFWRERLRGDHPPLPLPADRSRPASQSHRGAVRTRDLSSGLFRQVRDLAREENVTLFMLTLAAFKALLARYCGEADISVGTPIMQRPNEASEGLIGFFLNMLVLRSDLSGDPGFRELLQRVRATTLAAFQHQDVPFEKIVEDLNPPRDSSHQPLFQVAFVLQPTGETAPAFPGATVGPVATPVTTAKFDLTLFLEEKRGGLCATMEYSTDLFDAATVERMLASLELLLSGIVADPSRPLSRLPLLTPEEQRRLLVEWNDTAVDFPREKALHQLVEETVRRVPDACAILDHGERLTYRELDCRANRLAHRLRALGAQPGAFVGVCLERSADLIAALLGILKTGAAYVPFDPNAPRERLAAMLADAQPCAVLCDDETAVRHPGLGWENLAAAGNESTEPVGVAVAPESLAYLIYTSGSTGVPKGVALEHHSAVNFVNWARHTFSAEELAGVLAATSICFDLSVFEIFAPLAAGGTVVLAKNILELPDLPDANEVTLVNTVPSALAELVRVHELPEGVRTVFLAGEPLPASLVDELFASGTVRRVCDGYGPTETGYATFAERKRGEPAHIGSGIDNARLYILDAHREPVPPGVTGEIFIGGAGVARGYWRRDDITAQKFLASPFVVADRLYQTGDLARWRADGSIVYLGRADAQVKMRGYRVELGEIEGVLRGHPAVADTAVIVQAAGTAQARLIAYLVPRTTTPSARDLRAHLKKKLPDYMLPAAFVPLPRLPLTPNGKLDRRALPEPELERDAEGAGYTAPRTTAEIRVAEIWREVLKLDRVSIHDDFFEIGGHSLLAAKLVAEVDKKLGHKLPIAALFQSPTIESLARRLEEEDWTPLWSSLVPLQPHGSKPPIFFVHGVKGDVYGFLELSKLLPADQPSYGIQAIGLDGKTERHVTIEDMAAFYVKEIVAFQPEGPLHLSGFSMGGLIAYEIAQQLHRRGRRVALLALLDSGPIGPTPWRYFALARCSYLSKRSLFHLRQLWRGSPNQGWFEYLRNRFASLLHYVDLNRRKAPVVTAPPQKGIELPEVPGFFDYYHAVGSAYRLLPYPGSLDIFVSVYGEDNWRWYWKWLVRGGVTFHAFPGEHMDLLFNPRGRALVAKFLTTLLERARQKEPANISQRREPEPSLVS